MTPERLDLRLLPAALAAWLSAAVGVGWSPGRAVLTALLLLGAGALAVRLPTGGTHSPGWRTALAAVLVVSGAALAVAGLRGGAAQAGPIPELAAQRAQVTLVGTVASDPVEQEGTFEPYVVLRFNARRVAGRGQVTDVHSPTLVIADPSWAGVSLGERVELSGRLEPSRGRDLAGVVIANGPPNVVDQASWMWRGVAGVRSGIREAATPLPPAQRALLPALVDGDDSQLPDEVTSDFQRTGLTHLLAVSGSNLTLVLAFALFVASRCGVRSWGTSVVGLVCVVFFVLLARPEPSVLRAAAMGVVALAGLSTGSRRRGVRALCVCVVCLVLLDPWLARSVGFALSTLATAGILLLAPGWRDAMARWMPQLVAEAIAVPLSAQIVCTPLIAAISGQVSLVAVLSAARSTGRWSGHGRRSGRRRRRDGPANGGPSHGSRGRCARLVDHHRRSSYGRARWRQHRLAGRSSGVDGSHPGKRRADHWHETTTEPLLELPRRRVGPASGGRATSRLVGLAS